MLLSVVSLTAQRSAGGCKTHVNRLRATRNGQQRIDERCVRSELASVWTLHRYGTCPGRLQDVHKHHRDDEIGRDGAQKLVPASYVWSAEVAPAEQQFTSPHYGNQPPNLMPRRSIATSQAR